MSILGNNLLASYYAQQNNVLPAGYMRVACLESTGTQFIDTGLVFGDYDWEMEFSYIDRTIFGIRHQGQGLGTWNELNISPASGNLTYYYQNYNNRLIFANATLNLKKIKLSCVDGLFVDGVQKSSATFRNGNTSIDGIHLFLFLHYDLSIQAIETSTLSSYHGEVIFRNLNKEKIRNYIPSVRLSDSKPGLYDLCGSICPLTNTPFYVNAGSGEFVIPT